MDTAYSILSLSSIMESSEISDDTEVMAVSHTQEPTERHEQPAREDECIGNHDECEDTLNMPEALRPLLSTE